MGVSKQLIKSFTHSFDDSSWILWNLCLILKRKDLKTVAVFRSSQKLLCKTINSSSQNQRQWVLSERTLQRVHVKILFKSYSKILTSGSTIIRPFPAAVSTNSLLPNPGSWINASMNVSNHSVRHVILFRKAKLLNWQQLERKWRSMMQCHVKVQITFTWFLAKRRDVVFNILENRKFHFGLEWASTEIMYQRRCYTRLQGNTLIGKVTK